MVLLPFFKIPYGDRLAKNVRKQYVQIIPRSTHDPAVAKFELMINTHMVDRVKARESFSNGVLLFQEFEPLPDFSKLDCIAKMSKRYDFLNIE